MNTKQKILASIACSAFLISTAQAGSELLTLINMLHDNGTVDDAQYERLMDEINGEPKQAPQDKEVAQASSDEKSAIEFTVNKGGIHVKTADNEFSAKVGGRIQVDSAWYDRGHSDISNKTEIRRARLYIQGHMFNDWGYKLQYDFTGSGKAGIKDAFITYNGFEHVQLKLGNFKDPFMLQEQTSSKYVTFTERSLVDTFLSGRHIGIMASTKHKHWTASTGFFGDSVSGKDNGWSVSTRLTYAPINEKTRVLHVGIASDYRNTGDKESVRFKQRAETHVIGSNIIDTGTIYFADNILKLGAELAVVEGAFSLQSEYIWTTIERNGRPDLDFDGWYAEAGYFLTGESRNYKKGHFGGVSPDRVVGRGGWGAWQFAVRYSSVDLNDHEIDGGQADSVTVGLNWFPTSTLRFSGNYVNVLDLDGGHQHEIEPSLFQVRGQWAF